MNWNKKSYAEDVHNLILAECSNNLPNWHLPYCDTSNEEKQIKINISKKNIL
jgi:hypothetical protein